MISYPVASYSAGPYSPLIAFALRGLDKCWLESSRMWSHCYHLDGRREPNQSIPASDVFYSLNVLLGMSRLSRPDAPPFDLRPTFDRCITQLPTLPMSKYAYGMALWSAAELGFDLPPHVERYIYTFVEDRRNWSSLRAQDIGMLVAGLAAQSSIGNSRSRKMVGPLADFLINNYSGPSGLFFDAAQGWRRSFASFATQTYLTLACYNYHEVIGDARALQLANTCVKRLISLQGPSGEWPWFYYIPTGKVVDCYEVYSVHQDGMAPSFLEHAERHGVPGAKDAMVRGFEWILGKNQLNRSMLRPDLGMIVRSQLRRGELDNKLFRIMRSSFHAISNTSARLVDPSQLTLRLECRSYHLGWILWSFGKRVDLPEITHAECFSRHIRS